jgi:hypothetical protein
VHSHAYCSVQVEQPCLPKPRYATDTTAANYAYENPTTNGHTAATRTDDGSFAINLPWSFQYFCKSYSCVPPSLCGSCVVCRVSCVVCRVSCVVCRVSCVVCRVSCVVCRVSWLTSDDCAITVKCGSTPTVSCRGKRPRAAPPRTKKTRPTFHSPTYQTPAFHAVGRGEHFGLTSFCMWPQSSSSGD